MCLNGRGGAFHLGPVIRINSGADYPDERPALLRDPDNFFSNLDQPIGRQRGEPGYLFGEDAGFAAEALADLAKIDMKVAHQSLDNRSAKPIVVVRVETPCDREATRLHRFPVDMHGRSILNVAPRQGRVDSGIITVVSEQGYIVGLCCYRVAQDFQHGNVLMAEHFLILDLFDQKAVVHILADAAESLARERRCTAIHMSLPKTEGKGADAWLVRILRDRGHRFESLRMCKLLVPSP